jgi:hypothetical protein
LKGRSSNGPKKYKDMFNIPGHKEKAKLKTG